MSRTKSEHIVNGIMDRVKQQIHIPVEMRKVVEKEIAASLTSFSMKIRYDRDFLKNPNQGFVEYQKNHKENAARLEILDGLKNCGYLSRTKETTLYGEEEVVIELIAVKP